MDRSTVFTKTAKGLMEATGKTSVLARALRNVLKEIDGKASVGEVQAKLGKLSEAKLQESLDTLARDDFIREFVQAGRPAAAPAPGAAAAEADLDFTGLIPTTQTLAKQAEDAARAKAEAAVRAQAAAAEAARAKTEAEVAKARAEAGQKARLLATQAATQAAARARAEAEARATKEAEEQSRREAEARARIEAELNAKIDAERKAREEAERKAKEMLERERRQAEEKARREADALRAKLEEEHRAREEAERRAREQMERERREAEEKARLEAEALRAKLEEERKAREEAERRAREQAERERKEAEEKAQREAEALRVKLEEERKAREEAERTATLEAERRAREEAERKSREEAERKAREDAERKAREEAERERREAEEAARREAEVLRVKLEEERKAREEAERTARKEAERERKEVEEKAQREAEALRVRLEDERKAREVAERKAREEAERRAAEDAARGEREAEAKAREQAEQAARTEASERARREAEERGRETQEAEAKAQESAKAKSPDSLEHLVKVEFDLDAAWGRGGDAARAPAAAPEARVTAPEPELRAPLELPTKAEAPEPARGAAGEPQREEAPRKAAEEPLVPEAQVREHTEALARMKAEDEETERHFAEMEREIEAERAAAKTEPAPAEIEEPRQGRGREARAQPAQVEEIEEPVSRYRKPVKWGKPVALALFALLLVGLVAVNFVSFDGYIPQFEKLASAHLQQPVKIKALHLALVPVPHWRLDGVSVGAEGQLTVERVNAVAEIGSLFGEKKSFKSLELDSPVLSEAGLVALLFGKPQGQDFKVAEIVAKNAKLASKIVVLPVLDAKIAMGEDGAWRKIAFETPDRKTSVQLQPKEGVAQIEIETNAFSLPFSPEFILENFVAQGSLRPGELKLSEFKGAIFNGYLSGSADLKWGADWSLEGALSARAIDPARVAPALLEEGLLEGTGRYAMRAKSYDDLFAAPHIDGSFAVRKGMLLGVDLGRLLQGGTPGGKTAFTDLTGNLVREGGRTQLRQLLLVSGPMSAGGNADVDTVRNISGRFVVELKSPVAQARVNFSVSGNTREPRFSR